MSFVLAFALTRSAGAKDTSNEALTPQEALATFKLEPGLEIVAIAAEPLVVSPVAFTFDERGRLFVVENRGYPDWDGKITSEGRVAMLEDTDGDGRYDKRTEFATGLTYPNGICQWRGGVFVTCAPDIYYLKDTDGDGVADEKRVVLTGFSSSKTAQIRMSHPTLGLDGKIYVTSGLNAGKVTSPEHPERAPVEFSSSDSRFDPDSLMLESTGGRGQFGLAMDDFGRRFNCTNRSPFLQIMLEPWQLKRNPFLAFSSMVQEVSNIDYEAKVSPISHGAVTAAYMPSLMNAPHTGTFTSACGIVVYRGTALGPGFYGNAFICEPAQNLIQRQIVRPDGASFRSDVPHPDREFLASTDGWFRPVFCANGPGGALYVADMYRKEIDHPQYVPEEMRKELDFNAGKTRGRIYRIAQTNSRASSAKPFATEQGTPALINKLTTDDSWVRDTAFRLLLEQRDEQAVPLLTALTTEAKQAATRVSALWLLHALGKLDSTIVVEALKDADPGVRENAVKLTGAVLGSSPSTAGALVEAANDEDPRVRFECALQLSLLSGADSLRSLVDIAVRDGADRWTRAAILSGLSTDFPTFFHQFRARTESPPAAYAAVMNDLGRLFGAAGLTAVCRQMLVETIGAREPSTLPARLAAVVGLAEGLKARMKSQKESEAILRDVVDAEKTGQGPEVDLLRGFFAQAAELALDQKRPLADRVIAVNLLGFGSYSHFQPVAPVLLQSDNPPELQVAAIRSIERVGDPRGAAQLVEGKRWAAFTPRVREAVLSALTSQPAFLAVLFTALESRSFPVTDISSLRRGQLLKHKDESVRKRAETAFREFEGGDRMQAYEAAKSVLALPAQAKNGRETFVKICSSCHSYGGSGGQVGPELTGIKNQPAAALLLHIIVPNYEVSGGYQAFSLETKDGRTLSGWLAGETETSVSLRTVSEGETTILRSNIASLAAASTSLMPDGLEKTMTPQELADLLAYLKDGR